MALKDLIRATRREDGTTVDVRAVLDRYLVHRASRPSHREKGVWHPSEIASDRFCPRFEILRRRYKIRVPAEEVDVGKERIFDVGHALHRWYQEEYFGPSGILWGNWRCSRCHTVVAGVMPTDSCVACQWQGLGRDLIDVRCKEACGITEEHPEQDHRGRLAQEVGGRGGCIHCGWWGQWEFSETRVQIPELNIIGRIDGLLLDERGQPEIVLDIKTTNQHRFQSILSSGAAPEENVLQLNLYMRAMRKDRGVLFYICKNDGRVHEIHVRYDSALAEAKLGELSTIRNAVEHEVGARVPLPDRHSQCRGPLTKMAQDCPARGVCFKEKAEVFDG